MSYYFAMYRCSNCYLVAAVSIPKKTEAPRVFDCPACELPTLEKTERKLDFERLYYCDDGFTLTQNPVSQ